jgi:hypothetical protein
VREREGDRKRGGRERELFLAKKRKGEDMKLQARERKKL